MTLFLLPLFRFLLLFLRSCIIFCSLAKRRIIFAYLPSLRRIACKLVRDVYDECKRSAQTRFSLKLRVFRKSPQISACPPFRNLSPHMCLKRRHLAVPHAEDYIERTLAGSLVEKRAVQRKTDNTIIPKTIKISLKLMRRDRHVCV